MAPYQIRRLQPNLPDSTFLLAANIYRLFSEYNGSLLEFHKAIPRDVKTQFCALPARTRHEVARLLAVAKVKEDINFKGFVKAGMFEVSLVEETGETKPQILRKPLDRFSSLNQRAASDEGTAEAEPDTVRFNDEEVVTPKTIELNFKELLQKEEFYLLAVLHWYYVERDFLLRPNEHQTAIEEVTEARHSVMNYRIKLDAARAKLRIQHQVPEEEMLLTEELCEKFLVMFLPCQLNMLESRVDPETLVFPAISFRVRSCPLVSDKFLPKLSDEKKVIMEPFNVVSLWAALSLLNTGETLVVTSCPSPHFLAAVKQLAQARYLRLNIIVFGGATNSYPQTISTSKKPIKLDKNEIVKMTTFEEDFGSLSSDDARLTDVKAVWVIGDSSNSGLSNPLQTVAYAGEDISVLWKFCLPELPAQEMSQRNFKLLSFALKLSSIRAVVYSVRSVRPAESEAVVARALLYANQTFGKGKYTFSVSCPNVPLTPDEICECIRDDNSVRFLPKISTFGGYLALFSKERIVVKENTAAVVVKKTHRSHGDGKNKNKIPSLLVPEEQKFLKKKRPKPKPLPKAVAAAAARLYKGSRETTKESTIPPRN